MIDSATQPQPFRARVRRELALAPASRRRSAPRLRLGALCSMMWGLASSPAAAQAPYQQQLLPGFSSFATDLRPRPELADLDGDGDLDVIAGETTGQLRYFENTGAASSPAFIERTGSANPFSVIDVSSRSTPVLADLDADFDLDLIVGRDDGGLSYFENTGSSTAPAWLERTGTANPFGAIDVGVGSNPALADLDGDGDLDAVVGDSSGRLSYVANTGGSASPIFVLQIGTANPLSAFDVGSDSSPALGDLDGDGDLDAVVGELGGALFTFTNTGSSSAPAFVAATGSANPFGGLDLGAWSSPALADLDGDGDLDAVIGENAGSLFFFANTGTSSAPVFVAPSGSANPLVGVDVGSDSSLDVVDLDGDFDRDVVVGERYGSLLFFANTGTSAAPAFLARTGTANPFAGVDVGMYSNPDLADLDGDGDLDAVVGEYYGALFYFANTGTAVAPAFVEQTGGANPFDGLLLGYFSIPELADLDADGDLDAVVGRQSGGLSYLENTGASTAPVFVERTGGANPFAGVDVGDYSSPELSDLDGDGDLDLIVGEGGGGLRYFANTGTSSAPAFAELSGSANPFTGIDVGGYSSPELVDLDGDGDRDALVGANSGQLVFFRSLRIVPSGLPFADGFESGDTSAWTATVPAATIPP